ncbi:MAG: TonB family protein, partial [Verrucomicrobiota bacterium]
ILYYYPHYPRDFLIEGIRGEVVARYFVNEYGDVQNVKILKASQPAFADAVQLALLSWKFSPAMRDGKVIPLWLQQRFVFQPSRKSYFTIGRANPGLRERTVIPWTGFRPLYPNELREEKVVGHADVLIEVTVDGRVRRARIEQSTHPAFRAPAVEAARKWKFRPVDPYALYEQENGERPAFLNPDYGMVKKRLTFLFHPNAPAGGQTTEFPGQKINTLELK